MRRSRFSGIIPRENVALLHGGELIIPYAVSDYGFGPGGEALPPDLPQALSRQGLYAPGVFALNAGYLYACMILAAMTVGIIERRFFRAALWAFAGAGMSALGFMHSYRFDSSGYRDVLLPAWDWAFYYLIAGALLALTPLFLHPQRQNEEAEAP